jgi:hypothetical protein
MDRVKSAEIVREYMDPLSKKIIKREKKLKVYETFSTVERYLFQDAKGIIKRDIENEEKKIKWDREIFEKDRVPRNFLPLNKTFSKNVEKYIDTNLPDCVELDNNEVRRLIGYYDISKKGYVNKTNISNLFNDIKNLLLKQGILINEFKYNNELLNFYVTVEENCPIQSIKRCFNNILHNNWSEKVSLTKIRKKTQKSSLIWIISNA